MSLLAVAGANSVSGGYDIDNSLKFEHDNSEELNFTPSSSGSNQTWTFSCWFKITEIDISKPIFGHYTSADNQALVRILSTNNELSFRLVNGGTIRELKSDMLFRDTSAWYHLVVAVDTTDSTSTNRVKIYVNGEQITLTGTYPTPSLITYGINTSGINMDIGGSTTAAPTFTGFCGYMAEIHHIDGQQLAPTEFGETDSDTGIWKPKAYTGTYGTNGAYLKFSNSSSLGEDSAGSNDWSLVNITSVDQANDTPTNNFCTLNPLIQYGYGHIITEGATVATDNSSGLGGAAGTMAVNKGKWYWEAQASAGNTLLGVQDIEAVTSTNNNAHEYPYTMAMYLLQEYNYANDTSGRNDGSISGFVHSSSNWYGIALNMDDNEITYYKNGTALTPTFSLDGLSDLYLRPFTSSAGTVYFNFGAFYFDGIASSNSDANGYGSFEYAVPSGYYALCSKNLAEYG